MSAPKMAVLMLGMLSIGSSAWAQLVPPRVDTPAERAGYKDQPIVTSLYTADPAAHVFDGKIYVYNSHDIDSGVPYDGLGGHFAMRDYHVLHAAKPSGPYQVGPRALDIGQVPWASKELWAPDAAYKNGTYFLYFPAKDKEGIFRVGVATSTSPLGPFTPDPQPIADAVSIDPAVFTDDDGRSYMYTGGMWGGQLQRWATGTYDAAAGDGDINTPDSPAVAPRVALMADDMKHLAEKPRGVLLLDRQGAPLTMGDHERRFFEASWVFKRNGQYYFVYSTGDTHNLAYATGTSPYGPFRFQGNILTPVSGWTTHASVIEHGGKWWLYYADSQMSGGKDHLRNVKVTELRFNADGTIPEISPFTRSPAPRR